MDSEKAKWVEKPERKKTALEPTSVEVKIAVVPERPLAKGMVRMVAIDESGNEIGNEFDMAERGLVKGPYSNTAKFKLKKKVKP